MPFYNWGEFRESALTGAPNVAGADRGVYLTLVDAKDLIVTPGR